MEDMMVMSGFWYAGEDDGWVTFDHGPECKCGSKMVFPREYWDALGQPRILSAIFTPGEEQKASAAIHGPWGMI